MALFQGLTPLLEITMKKLLYGIAAGFICGAVAQSIASKNQEKLLELTQNLPTSLTLGPNASLDELKVHKARLESLIKEKSDEFKGLSQKKAEEFAGKAEAFAEKSQKKAEELASKAEAFAEKSQKKAEELSQMGKEKIAKFSNTVVKDQSDDQEPA